MKSAHEVEELQSEIAARDTQVATLERDLDTTQNDLENTLGDLKTTQHDLKESRSDVTMLRLKIDDLLHRLYGRSSEKLADGQLDFLGEAQQDDAARPQSVAQRRHNAAS